MEGRDIRRKKTVKEILVERGVVDAGKLSQAEALAKGSNRSVQTVLVEKGFLTKEALLALLSEEWQVEAADIASAKIEAETVMIVSEFVARRGLLLPFKREGESLFVAMADPCDVFLVEDLHMRTGLEIKPFLALPQDIVAGLDAVYGKPSGSPMGEYSARSDDFEVKYGLPDAPRKHLLVLEKGGMEVCDSQEAANSRINELGRENVREVWEMKKRSIVRSTPRT